MSRRDGYRHDVRRGRIAVLLAFALAASSVVVACGGDDGGGGDSGSAASSQTKLRVVHSSSLDPGEIAGFVGPIEYADQVGLKPLTPGDEKTLDSHATATQVLLSGKADIIGGSFVSDLQVIEQGVPIKAFCPFSSGFAAVIVGRDEVDSLDYLAQHKDTPVAIESAGGPVNFFFDLVLQARNIPLTTQDFTDGKIIEDSPQRVAALANGDVKATLINFFQLPPLQKQLGDKVHVLSDVMEDVGKGGIFLAFAAKTDWLDSHQDEAAKFCASVLKANKALTEDFDTFKAASDKYITPKVDAETLKTNWDAIAKYELFPFGNSLTEDAVDLVQKTAVKTNILKEPIPYDKVVDTAVIEKAVSLAGGQ
jgi:ABC-type nitrate/sulfonate/bicarbonate transport system substrate-binding protein